MSVLLSVIVGIFLFYCLFGSLLMISFWLIDKLTKEDNIMYIKKVFKFLFAVAVLPISLLLCLIAMLGHKAPHCPDDDV